MTYHIPQKTRDARLANMGCDNLGQLYKSYRETPMPSYDVI